MIAFCLVESSWTIRNCRMSIYFSRKQQLLQINSPQFRQRLTVFVKSFHVEQQQQQQRQKENNTHTNAAIFIIDVECLCHPKKERAAELFYHESVSS